MDEHAQFDRLITALTRWEGRLVRGSFVQVAGRVPLGTTEALRMTVRMRWRGELRYVACRPPVEVCRQYSLRPQRIRLFFDGGPRLEVNLEHLGNHAIRGDRLILRLQGDLHLILDPLLV